MAFTLTLRQITDYVLFIDHKISALSSRII
jgi:hypothetical protein